MNNKNLFLLFSLSLIFFFSICCKQYQIIGKVEDFYFKPIKAEYTFYNINENPMELKRIISIKKVYNKQWGWIFFEDHESILSQKTKEALKGMTKSDNFHSYRKVVLNYLEQKIEIILTDSNWEKKGDRFIVLTGPIWFGKRWTDLVNVNALGPIQVQPPIIKEKLTKKISQMKVKFILNKFNNVHFNNKLYNALESIMVFKLHNIEDEIITKTVYLKGLGIYSFDNFTLKKVIYFDN